MWSNTWCKTHETYINLWMGLESFHDAVSSDLQEEKVCPTSCTNLSSISSIDTEEPLYLYSNEQFEAMCTSKLNYKDVINNITNEKQTQILLDNIDKNILYKVSLKYQGSLVLQHLIKHLNYEQMENFYVTIIQPNLYTYVRTNYGCHILQQIIIQQSLDKKNTSALLNRINYDMMELISRDNNIIDIIVHQNGIFTLFEWIKSCCNKNIITYTIELLLSHIKHDTAKIIYYVKHPKITHLIQFLFQNCEKIEHQIQICECLMNDQVIAELSADIHANHMVQLMLQTLHDYLFSANCRANYQMYESVQDLYYSMLHQLLAPTVFIKNSSKKHASYLCERLLKTSPCQFINQLAQELLTQKCICNCAFSKYSNFVMATLLEQVDDSLRSLICKSLKFELSKYSFFNEHQTQVFRLIKKYL